MIILDFLVSKLCMTCFLTVKDAVYYYCVSIVAFYGLNSSFHLSGQWSFKFFVSDWVGTFCREKVTGLSSY